MIKILLLLISLNIQIQAFNLLDMLDKNDIIVKAEVIKEGSVHYEINTNSWTNNINRPYRIIGEPVTLKIITLFSGKSTNLIYVYNSIKLVGLNCTGHIFKKGEKGIYILTKIKNEEKYILKKDALSVLELSMELYLKNILEIKKKNSISNQQYKKLYNDLLNEQNFVVFNKKAGIFRELIISFGSDYNIDLSLLHKKIKTTDSSNLQYSIILFMNSLIDNGLFVSNKEMIAFYLDVLLMNDLKYGYYPKPISVSFIADQKLKKIVNGKYSVYKNMEQNLTKSEKIKYNLNP